MNKKAKIIIMFLLLFGHLHILFSQQVRINIEGSVKNATLFELEGEKTIMIDSVFSQDGVFQFALNSKQSGFYRLQLDNNHWVDFINDGNDVEIKTKYNDIKHSLEVIKSKSNILYYNFVKLNKSFKTKTDLLQIILTRYPSDDKFYSVTLNKLVELQKGYHKFVQETSQRNPTSFISRYIKTSQLSILPHSVDVGLQLAYLKLHALDNVDFNDASLIYSDAFTNKTIEYLTYFRNHQLRKDVLETEFMKAVDTLLNKAKVNQLVYQQITEYLIDGFKQFGFDKIIDYIVKNYVIEDDLCLDEKTENSIQKRIDQSKLLSIGSKVPNLILPDNEGKVIDLSTISTKKTLIVFYASWCPHCQTLLPQLNEIKKTHKDIEILAISLDNNTEDWHKFINDNNLSLTNLNDPKGWDGKAASDFYIYATPTMFLLDSEKIILGKPTTFEELSSIILKDEPDSIVSGKIIPDGKSIDPPIRVKAGDVCIVDLVQNYIVTGTLSGTFKIDFRILVYGPCGEPPGTYSEEWIAYGIFNGKLKGTPAFGKFSYIAKSKSGGEIVGKMVFNQGIKGNLHIKGNFNDKKLSYKGWLNE